VHHQRGAAVRSYHDLQVDLRILALQTLLGDQSAVLVMDLSDERIGSADGVPVVPRPGGLRSSLTEAMRPSSLNVTSSRPDSKVRQVIAGETRQPGTAPGGCLISSNDGRTNSGSSALPGRTTPFSNHAPGGRSPLTSKSGPFAVT